MMTNTRSFRLLAACGALALLAGCTTGGPFLKLDADRNGSGSPAEFDAYMKKEVFARVDASGDGSVSLKEWQNVNSKVDAAKFRKVDRNRDGAITRTEADAGFDREGSLDRLFKQIDSNKDSSLSQAELTAFRASLQQQPGTTQIEKLSNAAAKP